METPEVGQQELFIEHYCLIRDLDSLMEFPATTMLRESTAEPEDKAEKFCLRSGDTQLLLSGNTGEAKYIGKTGRTAIGAWHGMRWVLIKEVTPANVDINELFKIE
jgi:hypothetical protein